MAQMPSRANSPLWLPRWSGMTTSPFVRVGANSDGGDEGRGFPVTSNAGLQPLAVRTATETAGHVGRGPSLINEDKAVRIKSSLIVRRLLSPGFMMSGCWCSPACAVFFTGDSAPDEEPADRALAKHQDLVDQLLPQLLDRKVGLRCQYGQCRGFACLNPPGPAVAALWL